MLSQNVAKSTAPSYYMIRTNLPNRKPLNQWEGVYYFSGITKRQQHVLLLQRKRMQMAYIQRFNESRAVLSQKLEERPWIFQTQPEHQERFLLKEGETFNRTVEEAFALACGLARHGMHLEAAQCVESLHFSRHLTVEQYVRLIDSLAGDILQERVLHTDAMSDPALTFKLMGDEAGEARVREAYRWYEWGMDLLREEVHRRGGTSLGKKTAAASQLMNALMRVSLTGGYTHVVAVANTLYDQMGAHGIHPTMTTYELVVLSLALQGRHVEAEDIARFLHHNHSDQITIAIYDALLIGHREARAFDRCDRLWQELVDRRWPRAKPRTAEIYLRSIVDHANTSVSEPHQRFGNLNVVEKKKSRWCCPSWMSSASPARTSLGPSWTRSRTRCGSSRSTKTASTSGGGR
ncbi:unnamed protein product [Phytomonas sp. Hart1]|nr:unnamed protein product [Phytomonas sp. Hart1]|eukprot:CCW67448.1 unnamed protein product [Phytomonas sp. isolate Hart1]